MPAACGWSVGNCVLDLAFTFLRTDIGLLSLRLMAGERPQACGKQVRQSLNRDDAAGKNSGISPVNLHGGMGTTLTQRALMEHQWQAGLLAAARRTEESAK